MMRRITFFFFLLCMITAKISADEQKDITLSDDHNEETVTLPSLCNIFVSLAVSDEENGKLRLYIENIGEENSLLFFGADFNEKYLKRLHPKITYHKIFGGTKGNRTTDYNRNLNGITKIEPSDKRFMIEKEVCNGELQNIRIPMYIAKYKGKKRKQMELMEKQVVELNLKIELKPDEEFIQLTSEIDNYKMRLSEKPFCAHKKHKVSLERQKKYYEDERENMLEKIDSIQKVHANWFKGDRGYEKYDSLRIVLQKIDLADYETPDCGVAGLHLSTPVRRHSCRFCNLSLAQIYHRLDDCYQRIYNDRKQKSALIGDVRALYNCCTDSGCRKHSSEWRKGGFYKNKIVERYNKINGL